MREADLIDSVRRTFGRSARLTPTQAARLIEGHGYMPCMQAVGELRDRGMEWDAEAFDGLCRELGSRARERSQQQRDRAWDRHVDAVRAEETDAAIRARVAAIRQAHADLRAGAIDARTMLLRVADAYDQPPAQPAIAWSLRDQAAGMQPGRTGEAAMAAAGATARSVPF